VATLSRSLENNYAAGPWRRLSVADRPTKWELMLQSLELNESQARLLLKIPGSHKANQLRRWIEAHHRDRYVPPRFLSRKQRERFRWE
jgi:hypothetical protein